MLPPTAYVPDFVPAPDLALSRLQVELDWERRDDVPRCEYYCNDLVDVPYTYGRGRGVRTYLPRPWHEAVSDVRSRLESLTGCRFEVCFLNRYLDQSDQLGWHADDSPEMDDARPIGVVSLGVEREIWFRPNPSWSTPRETTKLKLGNGSLYLMAAGMQDSWQHRIPKASFRCGERISLTFRGYVSS